MNEMRRTWAVMNYKSADEGFRPDVAYIVDDEFLYYNMAANNGYLIYVDEQGHRFSRAGVSYGTYLKCDLDKLPDSVKVIFVANCFYVDSEDIANFNALKSEGRTIVWMRGSGYINESGADVSNISALTGFNLKSLGAIDGRTDIQDFDHPFMSGGKARSRAAPTLHR